MLSYLLLHQAANAVPTVEEGNVCRNGFKIETLSVISKAQEPTNIGFIEQDVYFFKFWRAMRFASASRELESII